MEHWKGLLPRAAMSNRTKINNLYIQTMMTGSSATFIKAPETKRINLPEYYPLED